MKHHAKCVAFIRQVTLILLSHFTICTACMHALCASLVCVMARYEARLSVFWLLYSDPQSKPIIKF